MPQLGRPTPALIIAVIALFVSLGGTGYAAIKITGKNVKNSSLTGKDVKNSSLTGSDVKDNSLTGSDVSESKLGKVPSASSADRAGSAGSANFASTAGSASSAGNANTVSGLAVKKFVTRVASGGGAQTAVELGGLRITMSCPGGDPAIEGVNVSGGAGQVRIASQSSTAGGSDGNGQSSFTTIDLDLGLTDGSGSTHAVFGNTAVTATYGWRDDGPACVIFGTATGG